LYATWYTENGLDCWLQVSGFTIGHQDLDQRVMCIILPKYKTLPYGLQDLPGKI
jgi:hypothetical protein